MPRVKVIKAIKSKLTASLPIFKVLASLAYLVPGISPIARLLDYFIQGHDVRVLSPFRGTFLIVCVIRAFKITKGSGREWRRSSWMLQDLLTGKGSHAKGLATKICNPNCSSFDGVLSLP